MGYETGLSRPWNDLYTYSRRIPQRRVRRKRQMLQTLSLDRWLAFIDQRWLTESFESGCILRRMSQKNRDNDAHGIIGNATFAVFWIFPSFFLQPLRERNTRIGCKKEINSIAWNRTEIPRDRSTVQASNSIFSCVRLRHLHRPFFTAQGKHELSTSRTEGKAFRVNVTLNFPEAYPATRCTWPRLYLTADNFHLDFSRVG